MGSSPLVAEVFVSFPSPRVTRCGQTKLPSAPGWNNLSWHKKCIALLSPSCILQAEEEKSGNKLQEKPKESEKPKDSGKVTITKVFDFAGEEVR